MSPMCQYSVGDEDGAPNLWHMVHYTARAVGGTGLIIFEMTDVEPDGRITVRDLGLWDAAQIEAYRRIIEQIHRYGAKVGIQIAHAGRKATSPELRPVAPSAIAFGPDYRVPAEMTPAEIDATIRAFGEAARRAVAAGVDMIEMHGAHGYLIHQFLSPISNHRRDAWGDYPRFALEAIRAVRAAIPDSMPLSLRVSAVEYDDRGYDFSTLIAYAKQFHEAGVDLFDVSSGGNVPGPRPQIYPGYQVPWAAEIRRRLGVPVIAVGKLESPALAESVLQQGLADLVAVAKGHLVNPHWANAAALELGAPVQVPEQYWLAFPPDLPRREGKK